MVAGRDIGCVCTWGGVVTVIGFAHVHTNVLRCTCPSVV